MIEPFSTDILEHVKQFHEKFVPEKIAKWSDEPGIDSDEVSFRLGFLCEKMEELVAAIEAGDLSGELDAYLDIAWVALGTALMRFGYSACACAMHEVFKANMSKVRIEGEYKIRKPEGWIGPDIESCIELNKKSKEGND